MIRKRRKVFCPGEDGTARQGIGVAVAWAIGGNDADVLRTRRRINELCLAL